MAVRNLEAVQQLQGSVASAESRPSRIGPISFGVKQMGARNAGNPHVACDVEGAGDVVWVGTPGHTGAPALDPTDERTPVADTDDPAVAADVAERLNDGEARREEDKWSA